MKASDIYEQVTARLIASIEEGVANPDGWVKPWRGGGKFSFNQRNAVTGKRYQGFNTIALMIACEDKGYESATWATFKQWEGEGRRVRKGEKGTHLIKWVEKKHTHPAGFNYCDDCNKGFPVGFAVFNVCQLDDYAPAEPLPTREWSLIDAGEAIARGALADGLTIEHRNQGRAYYDHSADRITLPTLEQFADAQGYYATLLHELAHASGHADRLAREYGKRFGDDKYAMEELTAELAAAFLGASSGITDTSNEVHHGNYLANWLRVLKADAKALAHVASKAQAAATYWEKRTVSAESETVAA